MATPLHEKSSIDEIRQRFDDDVERFSNLETGQAATIDAPLAMELITQAAIRSTSMIRRVVDIGCGAGNNSIKLRKSMDQDFEAILMDLSQPMLDRAKARLSEVNHSHIECVAGDFRNAQVENASVDVVLAAAVLHHLRDDDDWRVCFESIFAMLRPGGSVWITDLVTHGHPAVHDLMWSRYGNYLEALGGPEYRDKVFAYIDREDSPRPLMFQLELLRSVGFHEVDVLHKNSCFAAFGAVK